MSTKQMLRVRMGELLVHPRTGAVVAYAGQDVSPEHEAVLAHPSIGSVCYRVDVAEAPAVSVAPAKAPEKPASAKAEEPAKTS